MATIAASVAPADVPVTNGSARGLRSEPCSSAPEVASDPPTSTDPSTRGSRRSRTIVPFTSAEPRSAPRTSPGAIGTDPTRIPAAMLSTSITASATKLVATRTT